jgi:class 3 adenylate cyclase
MERQDIPNAATSRLAIQRPLRFEPELESQFLRDYEARALGERRVAILISCLMISGFGIIDKLLVPEALERLWLIRYGGFLPVFVLALAASWWKPIADRMQGFCSFLMIWASICIIEMTIVAPKPADTMYYAGLMLVIFGGYTFLRIRFGVAALTGWSIVGLYVAVTVARSEMEFPVLLNNTFFLISSSVMGMATAYWLERSVRGDYLANRLLDAERSKMERLLLTILPGAIATRLKDQENTIADYHPEVGVLFADIADFTRFAAVASAPKLVTLLNAMFSEFDELASRHGAEKIKTVGDAYMAIAGAPESHPAPLPALANLALDMQTAISRYNRATGQPFSLRIGIHHGPVVAGVIGSTKPAYDLWGDTVNVASRMMTHGEPGSIQVTEEVYQLLGDQYHFSPQRVINVKGRGEVAVYDLLGCAERAASA